VAPAAAAARQPARSGRACRPVDLTGPVRAPDGPSQAGRQEAPGRPAAEGPLVAARDPKAGDLLVPDAPPVALAPPGWKALPAVWARLAADGYPAGAGRPPVAVLHPFPGTAVLGAPAAAARRSPVESR
jgi:hypothetical protein